MTVISTSYAESERSMRARLRLWATMVDDNLSRSSMRPAASHGRCADCASGHQKFLLIESLVRCRQADLSLLALPRGHIFSCVANPQLDCLVPTGGSKDIAVWRERNCRNSI
jgi:hypothetical protein